MSNIKPTGYCPHCDREVLLHRGELDICLAIILLIFTAGIGLLVYIAWYYSKPQNMCVHCGTVITSITYKKASEALPYQEKTQSISNKERSSAQYVSTTSKSEKAKFCPFCGSELDSRSPKFCPSCGSEI